MRLIDGDKLMMMLADWWYSSFGEEETEESETIYAVMEKVEESLPHMTIEPERKKGQWNWIGFNIECPFCGYMPMFDSTEPLYNFCPNCGAALRPKS